MGGSQSNVEISLVEDLYREHGALNRLILIYEELISESPAQATEKLIQFFHFTATLVNDFIHKYHEESEEKNVFPVILKRSKNTHIKKIVSVLILQHKIARNLTKLILENTSVEIMKDSARKFIRMYLAHESREDTEVFPEYRRIVGSDMPNEDEDDHFVNAMHKIKEIEKELGINSLETYSY
jgi:hemerythrin superfamily protein